MSFRPFNINIILHLVQGEYYMGKKFRPTIVFDFDGVIHSYVSGWKGVDIVLDPPVKGIKDTIENLQKDYKIVVVSSRCKTREGINAIISYMAQHKIPYDEVMAHKPPAILYIDDRGIQFNGDTKKLLDDIRNFEHWITSSVKREYMNEENSI